ncbi:hypothetical protein [Amycolatopsis jejuensis]|uniref:hypothetical protein n=1 Tax=Amycolatopsis jejuensis TaxID=330084 RepID=UPI001FE1BB40|nr:hypothetical protein [Amycolatopsis jejuensis]
MGHSGVTRSGAGRAGGRVLAILLTVLVTSAGTATAAFADDGVARAETTSAGFGMLGPVGLVAVAFGIVGMTLGVLRQRRKARTRAAAVIRAAEPETDEPTRPLEPLRLP